MRALTGAMEGGDGFSPQVSRLDSLPLNPPAGKLGLRASRPRTRHEARHFASHCTIALKLSNSSRGGSAPATWRGLGAPMENGGGADELEQAPKDVPMRIPSTPPSYRDLLRSIPAERLPEVATAVATEDRYLHWDEMRFRTPPGDLSVEEWWVATKLARAGARRPLPFQDDTGRDFSFTEHGPLYRALHRLDQDFGAQFSTTYPRLASAATRPGQLMRSLVEEAIRSSQLEGAATTRRVAKEMLRSGRPPNDTSERMIANNYKAMDFIRNHAQDPLSSDMLLEIQRVLTTDTLDASDVGRFRNATDNVHVIDSDNQILHTPPPARELPERLSKLVAFANSSPDDRTLHPTIRAILLHFMVGYDHPFVDGNGRTARALFYWSMARSNYGLMQFISISEFIQGSTSAYARAYLHSENDDNDVTYFLHYNLRIIHHCVDALREHLARQTEEQRRLETLLIEGDAPPLNPRQAALLAHMTRHSDTIYTIEGHRNSHQISYHTARKDLDDLAKRGLLRVSTRGRKLLYRKGDAGEVGLRG